MIVSNVFSDPSIEPFIRVFALSSDLEDLKKFEESLDKQMSEPIFCERIERDCESEKRLIEKINRKYTIQQTD